MTGERILERVMLAFEGEGVPGWVDKRLAESPAAGVTLFMAVNVMRLGQVQELTAALQRAAGATGRAGSAGACSRMTCALVPLNPKPFTPARRGSSPLDHGSVLVGMRTGTSSQGMYGLG